MYTITRKLAMVCLAVVFSVLAYGCGGGGGGSVPVAGTPAGADDMAMNSAGEQARLDALRDVINEVDTSSITHGLIIRPGTYEIDQGDSMDLYDATFTCSEDAEVSCMVTAELNYDGTTTVTSAGGEATAMISDDGNTKLNTENSVILSTVATGLEIEPKTYEIEPGGSMDAGDATFTCPIVGVRCIVTVIADLDEDGEETGTVTVTSVGGLATAMNSDAGDMKLATEANSYTDTQVKAALAENYQTIPEGVYDIESGKGLDVGDARFQCEKGGLPCKVTVEVKPVVDDVQMATTTVTSDGGMVTVTNTREVMATRAAIKLLPATGPLGDRSRSC